MIRDRMIYLVVVAHQCGPYMPERSIADLDRATTIKDIAGGEFEGVVQVLECNPIEHTCRDVTEEIAAAVCDVWADNDEPLLDHQREFIEAHFGVSKANAFRRMEAAE